MLLLLQLLQPATPADGLRIVRLSVPQSVERGAAVQLACDFDLEGETLYSVRWYKNHEEFYRFLPQDLPRPATVTGTLAAHVDVRRLPLVTSCHHQLHACMHAEAGRVTSTLE